MAKRFALARYNDNGSLDNSFSFDGKVLTDFDVAPEEAITAVALDSRGRILAGGRAWGNSMESGETRSHFVVARYNADGNLDHSFNKDGKAITPVGANHYAAIASLVVDNSDRVIVGGLARSAGRDQFALARYCDDGLLDPGFGDGGIVLTEIEAALDDSIEAMVLDAQGRILVGGWAMLASGTKFALARYTDDGILDRQFGADGLVLTDFDGSAAHSIEAVAIDRLGRLVAGGWATVNGATCYALARYIESGALDESFGQNGKVLARFSATGDEMMKALRVDDSDRIVVGGLATVDEGTRFALARFCSDGSVDASFNQGGQVLTDFQCSSMESIRAIVIDQSGRIVAAGEAEQQFALARYLEDGTLDPSFGHAGKVLTDFQHAGYEGIWALAVDAEGRLVVGGSAE